ncbi:putative thiosulfate sulfurtransferase, mitochondrial isoform X2 [Cimex lectularius]|uniref:Rhodanese domain-containing protein n=1 Tax=Cimex lectularius TaxID=79782 RepID=A0A8I6R8L0_CIMLE|nr:putative thiosulfate sulfurtransferase, mitochondrial isoform X2 [Cimex lectularius]
MRGLSKAVIVGVGRDIGVTRQRSSTPVQRRDSTIHISKTNTTIRQEAMAEGQKTKTVAIEELLALAEKMSDPSVNALIIDVREPNEISETGIIPGGVNIPLGTVKAAMELPPDEFLSKYGKKKPDLDTKIIVSCRSGKRSTDAYQCLEKLGYTNLLNYDGGWLGYDKYKKEKCS